MTLCMAFVALSYICLVLNENEPRFYEMNSQVFIGINNFNHISIVCKIQITGLSPFAKSYYLCVFYVNIQFPIITIPVKYVKFVL